MKRAFVVLMLLVLLTSVAFGQAQMDKESFVWNVTFPSGTTYTHYERAGVFALSHTAELVWAGGTPASATITINGCMRGGSCSQLVQSTVTTTNQLLAFSGVYDYYTVQTTWSGGTATGATINLTGSTQTGGASSMMVCPNTVAINTAASGNLQLVALSGSSRIYVCSLSIQSAGATNVKFLQGTGSSCGSTPADLTGAYVFNTTPSSVNLAGGYGYVLRTQANGQALCINNSAAVQVSGFISYAQY